MPRKDPASTSVCGLHVPWNLQVLRQSDNRRKNDKYDHNGTIHTAT